MPCSWSTMVCVFTACKSKLSSMWHLSITVTSISLSLWHPSLSLWHLSVTVTSISLSLWHPSLCHCDISMSLWHPSLCHCDISMSLWVVTTHIWAPKEMYTVTGKYCTLARSALLHSQDVLLLNWNIWEPTSSDWNNRQFTDLRFLMRCEVKQNVQELRL